MRKASSLLMMAVFWITGLASARADIGPKPRTTGTGPEIPSGDMTGINVEMAAEEVTLILRPHPKDKDSQELAVHAVFHMKNPGEETNFETGFPVGAVMNMTCFRAKMDGKPAKVALVDRKGDPSEHFTEEEAKKKGPFTDARMGDYDFWYIWDARYKPHGETTIEVDYSVSILRDYRASRWAGYILHTGAPWKGPIGRAVVTLQCEGGLTFDHLRRVSPLQRARNEGDKIVWTFENFEPNKEDDIEICYDPKTQWAKDLEKQRRDAALTWTQRYVLADFLGNAASRKALPRMTTAEADAYLTALKDLLAEAKRNDGKLTLPGADPMLMQGLDEVLRPMNEKRRRAYAGVETSQPELRVATFRIFKPLFEEALKMQRDYPSKEATGVLDTYTRFMKDLLEGNVYLDLRELEPGFQPHGEGTLFRVEAFTPEEREEGTALLKEAAQ